MAKLRVHNFSLSLDGYGAGPDQSLEHPLGVDGHRLHEWTFATRTFHQMQGLDGGDEGLDDRFAAQGDIGIGATIMGATCSAPSGGRGATRTGPAGGVTTALPPPRVRAHPPSAPVDHDAGWDDVPLRRRRHRRRARAGLHAAAGDDVRLDGGVSTIQQYLRAGLIDELHLPIVPILLGRGERLFDHLDGGPVGYECVELVSSPAVAHARLARTAPAD